LAQNPTVKLAKDLPTQAAPAATALMRKYRKEAAHSYVPVAEGFRRRELGVIVST